MKCYASKRVLSAVQSQSLHKTTDEVLGNSLVTKLIKINKDNNKMSAFKRSTLCKGKKTSVVR